jgi:hypothetical protein
MEAASALIWEPLPKTPGVRVEGTANAIEVAVDVPPHGLAVIRVPLGVGLLTE